MEHELDIEHASLQAGTVDEHELKSTLNELRQTFESFKAANDARITEIEMHNTADVITEEKVERLNDQVARLSCMLQRPALSQNAAQAEPHDEEKAAFFDYVRHGNYAGGQLTTHNSSVTLTTGTPTARGALIPHNLYFKIAKQTENSSLMRRLATVQTVSTGSSLEHISTTGSFDANWGTNQTSSRTSSTEAQGFRTERIDFNELYANPVASSDFLEDTGIDIEAWLINEVAKAFAETENQAYVAGSGGTMPFGIAANRSRSTVKASDTNVKEHRTGVANRVATDMIGYLIGVYTDLASRYRHNAVWLMNAATISELRKLKNADGNYVWTPNLGEKFSESLFGYPLHEESSMPDISANTPFGLFGDVASAYRIVERRDITVLRDPYTKRPLTTFYVTKRVGGAIVDRHAMLYLTSAV